MPPVPFISVVVPAYNAELFIEDALNSIDQQSVSDYEIVVVDDGSTDGTYDRVKGWANAHPAIHVKIVRQENKGIGGARNTGINSSSGSYIAFLDADDVWLEPKLENVLQHLKKSPNLDLICHDEWIEENGRKIRRNYCGPYKSYRDLLYKGNSISTSATVVKKDKALIVGGFSEDLSFNGVEDYDFWLRLAKINCSFAYINVVLGVYRVFGQGITAKIAEHCQHNLNVVNAHFQEWQPKTPLYKYLIRKRRADIVRGGGRAFMRSGNHRAARQYFFTSLTCDLFNLKSWLFMFLNAVKIKL
ncbi:MAG: glycosyltransferase [Deltaproteobacteria bacterium]|nr:glycosyltransferase [Deltaproteobacteria bacterium]